VFLVALGCASLLGSATAVTTRRVPSSPSGRSFQTARISGEPAGCIIAAPWKLMVARRYGCQQRQDLHGEGHRL
jgi:hypothetical protein